MRLATEFRLQAYGRRLERAGLYWSVIKKGDAIAGAVLVKLALMDGTARLYTRYYDLDNISVWECVSGDAPAPETDIDAQIGRHRLRDPDLWVIEVENRADDALLDQDLP